MMYRPTKNVRFVANEDCLASNFKENADFSLTPKQTIKFELFHFNQSHQQVEAVLHTMVNSSLNDRKVSDMVRLKLFLLECQNSDEKLVCALSNS
mmetsp:Transcript_18162/g.25598  ORF Transcript_18162/g.25598 Transcript_18162/m.25598 type:complete len:95 (+) Transcript_18162:576-860(+)